MLATSTLERGRRLRGRAGRAVEHAHRTGAAGLRPGARARRSTLGWVSVRALWWSWVRWWSWSVAVVVVVGAVVVVVGAVVVVVGVVVVVVGAVVVVVVVVVVEVDVVGGRVRGVVVAGDGEPDEDAGQDGDEDQHDHDGHDEPRLGAVLRWLLG